MGEVENGMEWKGREEKIREDKSRRIIKVKEKEMNEEDKSDNNQTFSLAKANASLTILAPSPTYICTSCDAANFRKVAFDRAATARAISVFPVPGGP